MTRRVDGYLSLKIQRVHNDGLVFCSRNGETETWTMERPGQEPLGLGENFGQAKLAVDAFVNATTVIQGREMKAAKEKQS